MRRPLVLSAAAVLAVGTTLAVSSPTSATPVPAPQSAAAKSAPAGATTSSATTSALPDTSITLITGDRVRIAHQDGRQSITTEAADRGPDTAPVSFSTFVLRGDTYVVPSDAAAYAGGQLDWSLFDVSALVRGGLTDGAALPLHIDRVAGAADHTLPGTTRRSASAATEPSGDADHFGRALGRQLQRDAARAHGQRAAKASGPALLDGVRSIRLDSSTAHPKDPTPAGVAHKAPGFDMQTLTLAAIGRDGKAPSSTQTTDGYYLVEDVDDPTGFAAEIPVLPTKQNWSVPAGTYDVRAFVYTWFQKTIMFSDGSVDTVWDYSMSFVWRPQISIKHDTSLTFDARTANEIPIVATPDKDTTAGWRASGTTCCIPNFELVSDHTSPDGTDLPWYWQSGAHALDNNTVGLSMYATPSAQAVTDGSRNFYTYQRLESPSTGHIYDLEFPSPDGSVPATWTTRVRPSDLAAIPTTYASEVPNRPGIQARFGYQPWETTGVRPASPITEPTTRTEYVLATKDSRSTVWQESAEMDSSPAYPGADDMVGPFTRYTPGQKAPVRWFDGPRHPGAPQPGAVIPAGGGVGGRMSCPACRTADSLGFDVAPYVSGDSSTWGRALNAGNPLRGTHIADAETLSLYTNGTLSAQTTTAADPTLGSGPTQLPISPVRAQYKLDYQVARSTPWSSLSTLTDTRWDFTSQAPRTADPLPTGWTCGTLIGTCAFVPLMLLDYSVPLDEHEGVAAPGRVTFTVHAYHQPHAPTTATVDTPTVSISYDDGATWTPNTSVVPVGKGTFRVTITTPDPASIPGFVSLRVADTDSAGADISQTVIRAFTLSGSAASRGAGVGTAPPPGGIGGGTPTRAVCAAAAAGSAACNAIVRTTANGSPLATPGADLAGAAPAGYGPAELARAYQLPKTGGAGQTIAIVDAAGDPNIEADLAAYRAQYGLPACTSDSGCLRVVNQTGDGPQPSSGLQNWGLETALDMDMVSAACPGCHLLLVVAKTASFADLVVAEQTAARLGASAISNSYGSYESAGIQSFANAYRIPGVAVVASSGDAGFGLNGTLGGTQFPASLPTVTAVGGTRLVPDAGSARGWDETTWVNGGSGCSAYFTKPAYQTDTNCHMRTVADVSAVADPNTGVAVYDTALTTGAGWLVVGGTSAAAPLIAGMYGLAGNAATVGNPGYLYRHASAFHDVTSGSNGYCASTANYLCNARKGYDAPTGLGTPAGVAGL